MHLRRAFWLLWLAAALALYFFENNAGTRALLAASVLVPLFSLWAARHVSRRLTCALEAPDSAECGRPVSCRCAVRAGKLLAACRAVCAVTCENRLTGEASSLEAPADARGLAVFTLHSRHCGLAEIRLRRVDVYDWFGLWRFSKGADLRAETAVTPEGMDVLIETDPGRGDAGAAGDGRLRRSDEPGGTEIREYRPGDPVRRIHWKLSDKLDRLLLREPRDEDRDRVLVVLETRWPDRTDPDALDASMRAALDSVRALAAQGIPLVLCWDAGDEDGLRWAEALNEEEAEEARACLLSAAIGEGEPVTARLRAEWLGAHFRHVLVFSPRPDTDAIPLLELGPTTLVLPGTVPFTGADSGLQVVRFEGPETVLQV